MTTEIDPTSLYRLPWNFADNGISWLEPTAKCNLACEGCYRNTRNAQHKSLEQIRSELETFRRQRKSDCISIAGGDPLVHPQIVEIVRMIRDMGWKPIVNTNGLALTEEMLRRLKEAGVFGFTFHIDTSQKRPRLKAAGEKQLNALRSHYAGMLAAVGGIACSFNATVSSNTLDEVPDMVRWAQRNAAYVQTMVFILFRSPNLAGEDFDMLVGGRRLTDAAVYKETAWGGERMLFATDVAARIREADPLYEPSAFLNGTVNPTSLKWLLATRVVFDGEVMGYVSPRFQEIVQTVYHLLRGRYLSYPHPKHSALGRPAALLFGLIDRRMRKILWRIVKHILRRPWTLFRPAYLQSFMIIQPVNIEEDGRADMCDGCPDITVHEGKLVWSCRLEELLNFGTFFTFARRSQGKEEISAPAEHHTTSENPV